MQDYRVSLPCVTIEARSKEEAYGAVMLWLNTTLGVLPLTNAQVIAPVSIKKIDKPKETIDPKDNILQ